MSYTDLLLTTSPVAYWPLSADAADASGNGHTGAPSGTCTFGSPGLIPGETDSSLSLNGAGIVATPNLSLLPPFSLACLVQPNGDAGTSTGLATLMGYSSTRRILWRDATLASPNNCLVVEMGGPNLLTPAGSVPAGETTHVLYTNDGHTESVYLNGELAASQANAAATWNSAAWIGGYGPRTGAYQLVGLIEKVSAHNVALSADVVAQLAQQALDPIPGQGVYVMYWNGTAFVSAADGVTTTRPPEGTVFWQARGSGQTPAGAQTGDVLIP